MSARLLVIDDKVRPYPMSLVSAEHFRYHQAGTAEAGIVESPEYSLYCLEPDRREAIFVRVPAGVDPVRAPFYFQAQYEAAQALVAVPYRALHDLADRVRMDAANLILVYSTGRCGSTLVSRAFAGAEGVRSLSEPDVFTQLIALRETGRCDTAELSELLRSCARLVCGGQQRVAVKFRSFVVELAEVFHRHYPAAKNVFLYRGGYAWSRSTMRAFGAREAETDAQRAAVQDRLGTLLPLLAAYRAGKGRLLTPVEAMACHWVQLMECGLALHRRGIPVFTARYEELRTAPRETLRAMFVHCGLPALSGPVLDRVLAEDSQAGSSVGRDEVGPDVALDAAELATAIAELSSSISEDTVLPNTFALAGAG
ncbi:MAG TPA: hypothetical protein VFE14_05715 [Micromonosporaceae bacterium]|nr:hypothetical protein [Micromonosporaceae bacterium]